MINVVLFAEQSDSFIPTAIFAKPAAKKEFQK